LAHAGLEGDVVVIEISDGSIKKRPVSPLGASVEIALGSDKSA